MAKEQVKKFEVIILGEVMAKLMAETPHFMGNRFKQCLEEIYNSNKVVAFYERKGDHFVVVEK